MKPIIEISHKKQGLPRNNRTRQSHPRFPLTDYNYRPTAEASPSAIRPATRLPAFHKLSSEFLGAETTRDYIAELLYFILITCLAAWPIMLTLIAVIRMIRNY